PRVPGRPGAGAWRRGGPRRRYPGRAGPLPEAPPHPARRCGRQRRRRLPHRVALLPGRGTDGPALLPRRARPGHLCRPARGARDHLRGPRTRLRGRRRNRPHPRAGDPRRPGPATPPAAELSAFAEACALPPRPVVGPERMHEAGVFGIWAPVDRSTPQRAHLEDRLEFLREYYVGQVEQRRWYGFWDYGDVMHTYDTDRHNWRYDVGGYAWDNSELSPDLWLWTDFLRSGDASV